MFPCAARQSVPTLEPARTFNLHLPVIALPRAKNGDSPILRLFMKRVFDGCDDFRLVGNVSCIVQFNDDCHSGFYSTDPKAAQNRPLGGGSLWHFEQVLLGCAIFRRLEIAQAYSH